jgi:hypothetical protein
VKTKPELEPELGLIPDSVLEPEPEAGPGFGIKTRTFENKLFWEKRVWNQLLTTGFKSGYPNWNWSWF